jgi:DivIVA domain-containing protein
MTPEDIRSQQFSTRLLHGLSPEEVSAFLEDVAEAYGNLQDLNGSLMNRVQVLEDKLEAQSRQEAPPAAASLPSPGPGAGQIETLRATVLQEVEAMLHDAHAQVHTLLGGVKERESALLQEAETLKARCEIEAEQLLADARARAEALLASAHEEEATLRGEIERLTQSRLQLIDDIRASLDSCQQWLSTLDPRGRARGRREQLGDADEANHGLLRVEGYRAG